jgi:hypothetical protein
MGSPRDSAPDHHAGSTGSAVAGYFFAFYPWRFS